MKSTGRKAWGSLALRWDLRAHRYRLTLPAFTLKNCSSRVRRADGGVETVPWSAAEPAGEAVQLTGRTRSGEWMLKVSSRSNARGVCGLALEMTGTVSPGASVAELVPLHVPQLRADHVLIQGNTKGHCKTVLLPARQPETFTGGFQHMVTRRGTTLQISQPLMQESRSAITGEIKGGMVRDLAVSSQVGVASQRLRAEPACLYADADGHALMEAWAEEHRESARPISASPVGWNSWDYYRWTVTEDEVLKNAEFIASDPVLRRHVKRITIDDGWAYCYGEWEANPLFPHGMEWLAGKLHRMGFEAGLWFAPAIIEPHARIAQWDTDMLARGKSGFPCLAFECMQRQGFVLDPTVPKTQQWLYELFDRYAKRGYDYFKLDFLARLLDAPQFADAGVPRGQLVRKLIEPAYRALKGRAKIMGCGYDFTAGTALVDEVRISGDIAARWDAVKHNSLSISSRYWMHGRLWGNDPDFAVCRGRDTSDDPDLTRLLPCLVFIKPDTEKVTWQRGNLSDLSLEEARTLLSLVLVSGGTVNLSDDLTRLNSCGLDLVRRTVAAERGEAGIPLDLFTADYVTKWTQRLRRGFRALLINWEDRERELSLDLKALKLPGRKARNFWTDEPVSLRQGRLTRRLSPHACLLVTLNPD
jgi:hypothetical protein